MHILIAQRGRDVLVETNDEDIYPPDGPCIEFRMPKVASGYNEFLALANSSGYDGTGAIC
ncbi:hypothetical protein SBA7_400006 [Candidatus Sulfotelmatobacter sp. SbA7]|nr:hypothetical protein SBA7_400006 [Candidatus Sulfotelmatobacter sp. SbA7]